MVFKQRYVDNNTIALNNTKLLNHFNQRVEIIMASQAILQSLKMFKDAIFICAGAILFLILFSILFQYCRKMSRLRTIEKQALERYRQYRNIMNNRGEYQPLKESI